MDRWLRALIALVGVVAVVVGAFLVLDRGAGSSAPLDAAQDAANGFDAPTGWILEGRAASGEENELWTDDNAQVVLTYSTDTNGTDACADAQASMEELAGQRPLLQTGSSVGPGNFCTLTLRDVAGVDRFFTWVRREVVGDTAYSSTSVGSVEVVFQNDL